MSCAVALFLTALLVWEPWLAVALPPLRARDGGELFTLPGVDVPYILDGVGAAVEETWGAAQDLFVVPPPISSPTPLVLPNKGSSLESDPVYQLEIHNRPPPAVATSAPESANSPSDGGASPNLNPIPNGDAPGDPKEEPQTQPLSTPTATDDCDSATIADECDKVIDYIIFSKSCEHIDEDPILTLDAINQNQVITQTLTLIPGSDVLVTKSVRCDIFLWSVLLTRRKKDEIRKLPGVSDIIPNQPVGSSSFRAPADHLKEPVKSSAKLQRREILHDFEAADDLRFISTPQGHLMAESYSYDDTSGEKQRIIYVGFGLYGYPSEFERNGKSIVDAYLEGGTRERRPDLDSTCAISKAVGRRFGVVKNARLISVKVSPSMASVYDGLIQVDTYLRQIGLEKVRGYTTMAIEPEWPSEGKVSTQLYRLMRHFVNYWEIPVVVPSGSNLEDGHIPEPETAQLAYYLPVIATGGLNIYTWETLPWSTHMDDLTSADPGVMTWVSGAVRCASPEFHIEGPVSFAQMAGLIAYFLGLEGRGFLLRQDPLEPSLTVPQNVVKFITSDGASYVRSGSNVRSCWNGLGP